jgi:hypothetical protein
MALHDFIEEVQVLGRDLVDKVKSLVHEGNVQRIIVKDEHGDSGHSSRDRDGAGSGPCGSRCDLSACGEV